MTSRTQHLRRYLHASLLFCAFAFVILLPTTFDNVSQKIHLQTVEAACGTTILSGTCNLSDVTQKCRDGKGCTADDTNILNSLTQCDPNAGFLSGRVGSCTNQETQDGASATAILKANESPPSPTSCSGLYNYWSNADICIGRSIGVVVATVLISVTAWFLEIAGLAFNWLVNYTIVEFGSFFTESVRHGVEIAWTAFRDIANILIIGMFTFIALSIILGLKEFGQKKLIARVLIIAVLINFSLLFTEMIIDASNFTAKQIFDATEIGGKSTPSSNLSATNVRVEGKDVLYQFADAGIAGNFIKLSGVIGSQQTYKTLDAGADAINNGWLVFLNGIFTATLFLAAALILFYGCFLLVARAVLIIFLMITASLAFASYLIPTWETSSYGWKTWWDSLLKNAVFAPILILFLWVTLSIGHAMKPAGGTLGALLTEPTKGGNLESLFIYIIVLGLLFFSFKLSSSFSGKISGFNLASLVPGTGLGIAGAVTGLLGRNTFGSGARLARKVMVDSGWTGKEGNEGLMGRARRGATAAANRLARTTYNPLKPKLATTAGAALGVPKMFMGKEAIGAQSFEEKMSQKAKRAEELARQIGPSEAQRRESADREGRQRYREQHGQMEELIRQQTDTREQLIATTKQNQSERANAESGLRTDEFALERERRAQATSAEEHASKLRIAEARAANAQGDDARGEANAEVQSLRETRSRNMTEEAERIRTAQEAVVRRQQVVGRLNETAMAELANNRQFNEIKRSLEKNTRALDELGRTEEEAGHNAAQMAARGGHVDLARTLLWDKRAEYKIDDAVREHHAAQNWRHIRDAFRPEQETEAPRGRGTPAAPAAPPAHG